MNDMGNGILGMLRLSGKGKSVTIALAALALGVIMMLFGGDQAEEDVIDGVNIDELEMRLEELCSKVDGVGACSVMITADTVSEKLYAQNSQIGSEYSKSEYVTVSGGLIPVGERTMTVRGVAVVCTGGDSDRVKLELTELICALFHIGADRVSVVSGNP